MQIQELLTPESIELNFAPPPQEVWPALIALRNRRGKPPKHPVPGVSSAPELNPPKRALGKPAGTNKSPWVRGGWRGFWRCGGRATSR